jgi:hypothetical protein
MPKKQNGFGKSTSFSVKGFNTKVNKGKSLGSPGTYPGNRSYGSSVHRTVIEKYDIDSDWSRWRKGLEFSYLGAYLDFEELSSVLYQGTVDERQVTFDGHQFSTANSDSRSHYAARRTVLGIRDLGSVIEVLSDSSKYPENYERNELWVKVQQNQILGASRLRRVIGERLTDGSTQANVLNVLTEEKKPIKYTGKNSLENKSKITVTVPVADLQAVDYVVENNGNLNCLIGEIGYFPNFLIERPINNTDIFKDASNFFEVIVNDTSTGFEFKILDANTNLPPALLDISSLTPIYSTNNADSTLKGTYIFQKSDYQRYFGAQYLTAQVVKTEVSDLSYALMPFKIQSILEVNGNLEITGENLQTSIKLFTPGEPINYVIFADNSFTKTVIDNDKDGNYLHKPPAPGEALWKRLEPDVDPWIQPVFTETRYLDFSEVYCCSCPDFSHAVIRMPESLDDSGNTNNRQRKFPLPSAMGNDSYSQLGIGNAAGVVQSWETQKYKTSFRMCKHTVASMFINKLKVQEPKSYPSFDSRNKFEQRLKKDMDEMAQEFKAQLKRSGITTAEIIFMLALGLNLDEIETAYVMLNSNY